MLDCILDALIDTLKLLPYLLVTFLFLEFIEHKLSKKNEKPHDLSEYFGALKEMPDGLEEQRRLRDEWN